MAKKVLNLSGHHAADPPSSPSSASSSEDEQPRKHVDARASETEESEDDEEDEEFEIPPGFEAVQGSSSITRESILPSDKELWFFKLPKHMDASALANTSFKLSKDALAPGASITSVIAEGKTYSLQNEDLLLTQQLVNAFPLAKERKKFTLGKPFMRCFSLVETRSAVKRSADEEETTTTKATPEKKSKSTKSKHSSSKSEPAKASKKQKTAK